jgi:hypothetical protein
MTALSWKLLFRVRHFIKKNDSLQKPRNLITTDIADYLKTPKQTSIACHSSIENQFIESGIVHNTLTTFLRCGTSVAK